MKADPALVSSGRAPCPKCGRKGLGYAPHPHARGHYDFSRMRCRYCRTMFKVARSSPAE